MLTGFAYGLDGGRGMKEREESMILSTSTGRMGYHGEALYRKCHKDMNYHN